MKARKPPEVCPVCEADVPPDAKACPECGACYNSGWKDDDDGHEEEIDYNVLDLPDDAYDEEDRRTMERKSKPAISVKWRLVALGILIVLFFCLWKWLGHQAMNWGGSTK